MLIITATFPDENTQNFGKPEDLLRYMGEEGYTEVRVNAQFIHDVFADMSMTVDEIQGWIDMKAELDMKMDGLKTKDEKRPAKWGLWAGRKKYLSRLL